MAAVISIAIFLFYIPVHLQVGNRAFHRAPGEPKIGSDSFDPRPTLTLGGGHAFEVHIDCFRPMRQIAVGIDCVKIADGITSSRFDMWSIALWFPFNGLLIVSSCVLSLFRRKFGLDRFNQLCPPGVADYSVLSLGDSVWFLKSYSPFQKQP